MIDSRRRTATGEAESAVGEIMTMVQQPALLKVATYNVHRSIGTDGRHNPARTAAVIRETGASVVALQEVESRTNDPDALARETGLTAIPGHTRNGAHGMFGNLLLTRLTILESKLVDLSFGAREPRGLIDACLQTDQGARVRCIATHFGLAWRERNHQHHLLMTLLSGDLTVPIVLMGDFNEWRPLSGTLRALNRFMGHSRAVRSFPSRLPILPLDRIWVRPCELLVRVDTWRSPRARRASDHLPVIAELELPASAG